MRGMLLGEKEPKLLEAAPVPGLLLGMFVRAIVTLCFEHFPIAKFQLTAPNGVRIDLRR